MNFKKLNSMDYCVIPIKEIPNGFNHKGYATGGGFDFVLYSKQIVKNGDSETWIIGESHLHEQNRGALFLKYKFTPKIWRELKEHIGNFSFSEENDFRNWNEPSWILNVMDYLLVNHKELFKIKDLTNETFFD